MCGIAGYIGPATIDQRRVTHCMSLMGRRGPDAEGTYHHVHASGRNVYLLHTRLSVLDLDPRSNQPFQFGRSCIAFNGEIYNYIELRDELKQIGYEFETEGDTEVLASALDTWGSEALNRSEGMWALAAYNSHTGSLLLSRDRFGEKPLYIHRDSGGGIFFASEVKFIFSLTGRRLPINSQHIYRYLVNGYKALYKARTTFFEGLDELSPGCTMRIDSDGAEATNRYWRPSFSQDDSLDRSSCVRMTRDALIRSVELRLRSDVPLAFCLSGGVDSNSLIAIAKRELNCDVEGFTITSTDPRYDERDIVSRVAGELGIKHQMVPLETSGFLARLRELVKYHDAPVYTITYYTQWLLLEAIRKAGYKVSISGTAADEIFSGYYDHHLAYFYAMRSDHGLHKTAVRNWEKHIKPFVRNPYLSDPDLFKQDPEFREHIFLDAEHFSAFLNFVWNEDFFEGQYSDDLLRNRMLNEMFHETVPVILHEDDLNAMYHSVENRSPFLDSRLFDTASRIPTQHLIHNGRAKSVLRDAMRGLVPDVVLDNPQKVGFNAPILELLDRNDPATRSEVLSDSPIFDHVNREMIEQLLGQDDLPNSRSKFLFYFLNAKIFLEEFSS